VGGTIAGRGVARACASPAALARLCAVATDGSSTIVELDPATGAEINRFPAPEFTSQGPDGLAYDGHSLWYINGFGSRNLWELDPDTGAVRSSTLITAGSGGYDGLAAVGRPVSIQDSSLSDLLDFDPASPTVTRILDIDEQNPGIFLVGGAAGITGPDAIIATVNSGTQVVEIDPATGLVTHQFSTFNTYL